MDIVTIMDDLKQNLTKHRYEHSLSVAQVSKELAKQQRVNEETAYMAGLLHDVCKEKNQQILLHYVDRDDILYQTEFYCAYPIWHGFAGANYAVEKFQIKDTSILNAIKYHTTGRKKMSEIEKIVFLADMLSNDRTYSEKNHLLTLAQSNFEQGFLKGLTITIQHLLSKQVVIYPQTIDCYNYYCKLK